MSYEGVIDPDSAAGAAELAFEQAVAVLPRAVASASAAAASAAAAAASQAAITTLLSAIGIPHRWTGTVLQIRLPDGSYPPGADLQGVEGPIGETPVIGVGTVMEGEFAVIAHVDDPARPILDFVLPRGFAGWTPSVALVADGDRRVMQIVDWVGSAGTKPAVDLYVGSSGLVPDLASAVDLRGAASGLGVTGSPTPGHLAIFDMATAVRDGGALTAFGGSLVAALNAGAVKALLQIAVGDVTGAQASLGFTPENVANKGIASGYAGLDSTGKVPTSQLPASVLGDVRYVGAWNAATNSPAIPAASAANMGSYYVVQTAGTTSINGQSDWQPGDWLVSNGTTWDKIDNTDAVKSVAGLVGAIAASDLRTALSLVVGTNVQAWDADLDAISALTTTSFGRSLLTSTSASALKSALAIVAADIGDATATGRSVLTVASVAALTALLNIVVGDSGSGGTKGLVPAPAAGDAAAGKFLSAAGTWAAPGSGSAPTAYTVKTSAYTAVAADKGTEIEVQGATTLTLGATTAVAGWFMWVRKQDLVGVGAIAPASGTIAGRSSISLYNEGFLIYYDAAASTAASAPVYRCIGRPKKFTISSTTIASQVTSVSLTGGFSDPELSAISGHFEGLTFGGSGDVLMMQVIKSGAAQSSSYYNSGVSISSNSVQTVPTSNQPGFSFGIVQPVLWDGEFALYQFGQSTPTKQRVTTRSLVPSTAGSQSAIVDGYQSLAAAITGVVLLGQNGAGITGGVITLEGTR